MDKTYHPAEVETRLYKQWEQSGAFASGADRNSAIAPGAKPYTIVIPPPNVTGSLHMGHALNNTLQDILTRYNRMRGRDALWQPGMDHAGIATQMVVERQLGEEGKTRHDLGRDAFIDRVWQWKDESGGAITEQLRRLGSSCDWERERFTMDDGLSEAVRKVFVTLHKEGLVYRDKRLVNWDPKLHTAISDLEVEQRETNGHMWHFRYPVEGEPGRFIVVATTRPETMLGDTAVAVHPDDDRYTDLVGKHVILPIVGRRIPIVADEYADPEKGSGAVKITPAHDFNDFEVGRRHDLPMISIFDENACLNDDVPEHLRGLDRDEARKRVLAELDAAGLLAETEDNPMTVPYGDRSGVVIEPRLTDQWFVDAATLAKPALAAVEDGRINFVPKHWENTYFDWMRNIQPWCVSRQIWWGHRIPAWFAPDGKIFVELTSEDAHAAAEAHYGHKIDLEQETDVLDTWFSSALWPFSTLGWPDKTPELDRHYPTDALVTGFDIIFFWVARMIMMGMHFMGEAPFHTVYIHALVRDEAGQKMSKSKGNVLDPLELIDDYGTDALRFTLTALAAQGRDIKLSSNRIEGYRNFVTKIWNAARYAEMNGCVPIDGFDPASCKLTVNRWIVGETAAAARDTAEGIEAYRFNDAAGALYRFSWNTFCDWYLEFTKPILAGDDAEAAAEVRAVTAWVMDTLLHLLHPVMPFVTEELWAARAPDGQARPHMLIAGKWPDLGPSFADPGAKAEMDWLVRLVSEIRTLRSEMNVPPGAKLDLLLKGAGDETLARLDTHMDLLLRLARLETATAHDGDIPKGSVQAVLDDATIILPIGDVIDIAQERARLEKESAKIDGEISTIDKKLGNAGFIAKAPEAVIEEQRARRADYETSRTKLGEALERLSALD
jgi:valyl-tRNA synthetase